MIILDGTCDVIKPLLLDREPYKSIIKLEPDDVDP